MDDKFSDRVHALAALLIADPRNAEVDPGKIAVWSVAYVRAVDAALVQCPETQSVTLQRALSGDTVRAFTGAPAEETPLGSYQRGLAEGRANPWRAMAEIGDEFSSDLIVVAMRADGKSVTVDVLAPFMINIGAPEYVGWLPLPTVAK